METIANKDSAAKKTNKIIIFYYTIKHSVRYLYLSFRKNKQTNKQTNEKQKKKQKKTKKHC